MTRVGRIKLSPGPHKIVVPDITNLAQEDSFRVKGKGPASLSTIDVRRVERVCEPDDDAEDLYAELRSLEKKLAAINDEIDVYNHRLEHINTMTAEFSGLFGQAFAAQEVEIKALEVMDARATSLAEETYDKLQELNQGAEEVSTQIEVVRRNIGQIDSERKTVVTFSVDISLDVTQESEIELYVTYQCQGAGWNPSYDVDLLSEKTMFRRVALVENRTLEPWKDVFLTVSTATSRPVEAIEGVPFYISEYSPPVARRAMRMKVKKSAKPQPPPSPAPIALAQAPPEPAEMEEVFAEASESASGIAIYELPKPVTIPYDYEPHPVTLTEEELDSKTIHYWYADGMSEVVAQDEVTNGDNVILPGKAKVYAEGDYIGETWIQQASPRERFKLGTRTAYDVKAKKQLVKKEIEKAGLTRGKLRRYYKYKIEIKSFSKKPVEIEIVDRIPHSNSTAIEVRFDKAKLGLEKFELGIMHWKKTVEPKETLEIIYDYEVSWEKDITIVPPLP